MAEPTPFDHLITVVTVTRNDLAGLRRTFESLEHQTFREAQHVVIDGASTDGSAEWLRSASALEQTVVISEPDRGVYDAMNKGAALATGALLTFLNAGDAYAHEQVLERAVGAGEDPGWRWGFGLAQVVGSDGRPIRPVARSRYTFRRHALGLISVPHQATFMRTAFFRELGGFDLRFQLAADTDLLLRAATVTSPRTWPTVDVRYETGGLSARHVYRMLLEKHRVRRGIPGASLWPWALDLAWTVGQIVAVAMRRAGKRILNLATGGRFTNWWATRQ